MAFMIQASLKLIILSIKTRPNLAFVNSLQILDPAADYSGDFSGTFKQANKIGPESSTKFAGDPT